MEHCGGKTYKEIWEIFKAKHGNTAENLAIHRKWQKLGSAMR